MSIPRTEDEIAQAKRTELQAGPAENVVSTACVNCGMRFATLATFRVWDCGDGMPGWRLRCVNCGDTAAGELKPMGFDNVKRVK